MGTTALTPHLTATDRFGHTWTFNIPLLAVGLSVGQSAVSYPPTLSWHVEEGGEGGKQRKVIRFFGSAQMIQTLASLCLLVFLPGQWHL